MTEWVRRRAEYELVCKGGPPLDVLTELSSHFPTLTFEVEWEDPCHGSLGCAVIVDGNRSVLRLDSLLGYSKEKFRKVYEERFQEEWSDRDDAADVALSLEILRIATGRFFGRSRDEQNEGDGLRDVASRFARQVVQESDNLSPFTGAGVVTMESYQWDERSARFPGDDHPAIEGINERVLAILEGLEPPLPQGERPKSQAEGFQVGDGDGNLFRFRDK